MPDTPDSPRPETVLAFDFGLRRIGLAVGQDVTASATPLGTAANGAAGPDWARIASLVEDWRPQRLLVGLPLNADGSPSALAGAVAEFRGNLARFGLPVEAVDERYTSLEARLHVRRLRQAGLRGRVRKGAIDALAAVQIAERWLARPRPGIEHTPAQQSE